MQQILVIEDDGALQRVLKRLFEAEGFRLRRTRRLYVLNNCVSP
jgi:CheY-like chemotaxis protein